MKQLKRKTLHCALVQALGTGLALTMIATGAQAQQAQKVDKIEVTGSNIKRVDTESVAPVEIITREAIERTGQPTVADVLRNIPANSGGSFGESFSNSFAPGAAGISLRGLGQKTTLVLLNGRRVSGYGFAQNLQDSFVDLNSIPTSAVERIEILKDGASAVYGSDAIAGVVNIILRKDYKGVEVSAYGGRFEGKNDVRVGLTAGMGDLSKDKWTAFGTFDYYQRDLLMLSDTDFGHTRDFRGYDGGRNAQSLTGGGTWRQQNATNGNTAVQRAITECRGTIIDGPEAVRRGLIAAPLANTAFNIPGNTFCSQDFNNQFTALPETERYGFLGRVTAAISNTATAYVELGLSRVDSFQRFQDPFFAGTTGLTPTAAGLSPFTYNVIFAPGVAGNPFANNARYQGVLGDMGTRNTDISSDTIRLLGGANYTFGKWDFDSAIGYSKNEVDSISENGITLAGTSAVFGVPSTPQPPIPVSTASLYNLNAFSGNTNAVRDSFRINAKRTAESELKVIDTKASTELWQMSAGAVGLALGAEYREESLKDRPDARAQNGDILGQGVTATDGKRDTTAIYGELAIPITKAIEMQIAARYDKYSDYGSNTTPKVGVKWKPTNSLLLRANWGKGFRAPTLPEISPSVATFFTQVIDPLTEQAVQISGVFAGNPSLRAEESESATVGVIWEPSRNFSIGLNYYDIKWEDIVASPSFQSIVDSGDPTRVIRDPDTGAIVTVLSNYINLNDVRTKGLDFDTRYLLSTDIGRFVLRANISYVDSYKEGGVEVAGTNGGTNTIPRTKGVLGVDWDTGPFSFTANMNYVHHYYQNLLPASRFTAQDPQFQNGTFNEQINHYRTVDFFGKYQFNKNLSFTLSLLNAENAKPPYDPGFSTTFNYDFSQYDIRGRAVRVGLTYKM